MLENADTGSPCLRGEGHKKGVSPRNTLNLRLLQIRLSLHKLTSPASPLATNKSDPDSGVVDVGKNLPTISPVLLMPKAWVADAPGTSKVVKPPLTYKKPCVA